MAGDADGVPGVAYGAKALTAEQLLPRLHRSAASRLMADLAEQVAELKRQDGKDLLLTGGSSLAAALTDHGLIDEYHIAVHPVVLGGGRPLFVPRDERLGLRLAESRTCDSQVVVMRYDSV
ncbi:dihydrofolate reductase family protein [Nonomuraea aurantiaca]|uniref:dihydrofolate reductase family protein n=1 Tax=Nonomuraea aurantiaca TaxID=2878562 RepID=UPI001CDA32C3|nr:dihydrofolate reductase family protein [Nonomuraea aurantiaca]MCA2225664.1 dihydrofolate reductase family protein [Nonomuraea aurantiaca]